MALPFSLVLYGLAIWAELRGALTLTGGEFVYPLDDTYIHMSLARTLALHGVWGITPQEFSGSSSSPLWTLILAGLFAAAGANAYIPLVLNVIAGAALVFVVDRALSPGLHAAWRLAATSLIVFAMPLPTLVFLAMEHVLHALITLLFVFAAAAIYRGETVRGRVAIVAALAFALVGARYEGLFVVIPVCFLVWARHGLRPALVIGAAGIVPVVGYGFFALSQGGFFVPNGLLVKAVAPLLGHPPPEGFHSRSPVLPLWFLIALSAVLLFDRTDRRARFLHLSFLPAAGLHLGLAATGHLFRYEGYLIPLGVVAIATQVAVFGFHPRFYTNASRLARTLFWALIVAPFLIRGGMAALITPRACANIHGQQVRMARLVHARLDEGAVALNDIGAVAWFGAVPILDLAGLGSDDVARLRIQGRFGPEAIRPLIREHGVRLAMLYDSWFRGALPPEWTRIGEWMTPDNVVLGDARVSFYAVDPAAAERLKRAIDDFGGAESGGD
ncbi:hypothetical protein [Methylococcus capsulatus]|jgi:hypothetical protein|uniref:hypothetical protein n=1 Tax=Methylococcus capsulatus TaxID=414 RepID=UPI001C5309B5|nr:hypothetical protein [Methylococcus capsulatus]QXP89628.1 hypothetical protein KW114_11015 [Methylococcus capsulatus]